MKRKQQVIVTIKEWFKIIEEWDGAGKLDVKSIISLEKEKENIKK